MSAQNGGRLGAAAIVMMVFLVIGGYVGMMFHQQRQATKNEVFGAQPFVSNTWKADESGPTRFSMHEDLITNHLKRGATEAEIEALVGPIDCRKTEEDEICQIRFGSTPWGRGQRFLHLEMRNGKYWQAVGYRE